MARKVSDVKDDPIFRGFEGQKSGQFLVSRDVWQIRIIGRGGFLSGL